MTQSVVPGRHRAPGRHNPLTELTGMIARAGENGVKASAVLAASGGLVAAFALPAQAASAGTTKPAGSTVALAPTGPAAAFTASPAALSAKASSTVQAAATTAAAEATVIEAPASSAPSAVATVGVSGFAAVEKPAPPPPPPPVVEQAASRTATRAALGTAAPAPAAPAPAVNVPASVGGGVLGVAAAYSGIWYVYGGSTPAGFDCSGYTSYVYRQVGINLPRTANDQKNFATPVSNPQPGDLVFFGSGYAYHVGIYAGNGMMYDSPRTGTQSGLHPIWTSDVTYGRV